MPTPPRRPDAVVLPALHTKAGEAPKATVVELPPGGVDFDDPRQVACLRVWAAAVRDREAGFAAVRPEAAAAARTLCSLLDLLGATASASNRAILRANASTLLARIRAELGQ